MGEMSREEVAYVFLSASLKANKKKPYFKAIYPLFWDNIFLLFQKSIWRLLN